MSRPVVTVDGRRLTSRQSSSLRRAVHLTVRHDREHLDDLEAVRDLLEGVDEMDADEREGSEAPKLARVLP